MSLIQLNNSDGSYDRLKTAWRDQCVTAGEEPELYAEGTFLVLDQLVAKPERRSGVYGVSHNGQVPEIICQANCTPLPGHPKPVLRVRMVTMSPELDFGTGTAAEGRYIGNLVDLFTGIVVLAQSVEHSHMTAREIKFHLRSPQDFAFFRALCGPLGKMSRFESVEMRGAWLYIMLASDSIS